MARPSLRSNRLTFPRMVGLVLPLALLTACADSGPVSPDEGSTSSVRSEAVSAPGLTSTTGGGLVISQVYGGGGNSGAPLQNDFVELFNASSESISLSGLSVQYTSATGTGNFGANAGLRVALPDSVMAPGQYFLIALAGGSNGDPLPPADQTGTINMAGANGKVALVTGTESLGCNGGNNECDDEQLSRIIDLVGYGSANFFEGTSAAPTLSNSTAALRLEGGCVDTDDNGADFEAGAPFPRNMASAPSPCDGEGEVTPPAVTSVSPADGTANVALDASILVTFDRSVVLGGDWIGITCDVSASRTTTTTGGPASWAVEVDGEFAPGETCTVVISADQVADESDASNALAADVSWSFTAAEAAGSLPEGLVISQVYGAGGNSGAVFQNDFVEIFNRTNRPLSLAGLSIQYASATGTGNFGQNQNQLVILPGVTLAPGQYFLLSLAGGTNGEPLPDADATGSINMAAANGKVVLVTGTESLGCNGGSTPCSQAQLDRIVDLVGYGSANFFEGTAAAPAISATTAAFRLEGGCVDTDDNGADFIAARPAPRNTGSPTAECGVPAVAQVSPTDGAENVALTASIEVRFTSPVAVSGEWITLSCSETGARDLVESGGPQGPQDWTLEVEGDFAPGESCTATIVANQVTNPDDAGLTLAQDVVWSFTTLEANVCELPFTPTYEIQGPGSETPLAGQTITTSGVVIGDFQGPAPALRGFYIQDPVGDDDPLTSDGLFIFNGNSVDVELGDLVRVTGVAGEFQGQTQLSQVSSIVTCGTGATVEPTDVLLPFPSADYLERYEGMLVRLPQPLTVTEHRFLGRFGEVTLSSGGRLPQPTSIAMPGAPALAVAAENALNRIIVDDELNNQNRDPILFGREGNPLTAQNTLRAGDTAEGIVGVMTFTWAGNAASGNAFRVRPVGALDGGVPEFTPANPRPMAPPSVGGSLRVAAFNLENYFTDFSGCTRGTLGEPVDCRGASNQTEFDRQVAKTIPALSELDVDVLGLIELQNNGFGPGSAIADLTNRMRAATGQPWAFIDADAETGEVDALGTDAIVLGLIYREDRVTPVGRTAVLNSIEFVNGGNSRPGSRPTLVQAFEDEAGGRFLSGVVHLRSKGGSPCDIGDQGDGQGNCNVMRTNAVNELLAWLETDPTDTGEEDVLLIGDFNSYAMEDPIRALEAAGYTNLITTGPGTRSYSFVFDGEWGYLDHALASPSLAPQVAGAALWPINADEPNVLGYSTAFKSPNQLTTLFSPDPFRSADHDPVVVGLDLVPGIVAGFGGFLPPFANRDEAFRIQAGRTLPLRFSLGGDLGLDIFAVGFPASREVSCSTGEAMETPQPILQPGESGLTYSPGNSIYRLNWATERGWEGSCRELIVRFRDQSQITHTFDFRR